MKNAVTVLWGAALAGLLLHCSSSSSSNPNEPVDSGQAPPPTNGGDAGVDPNADAGADAAAEAGPRAIPTTLSGFGLFTGAPDSKGHLTPVSGTIPYDLNSVLFSDYALKSRTITIPPGEKAGYQPESVLDFPVGTIFSKTFAFPADLRAPDVAVRVVETRILIHQPSGWEAYPYLWNDQQTEATLVPGGRVAKIALVDLQGASQNFDYLVPSRNQCQQCHHLLDDGGKQVMHPIGPKARYLNRNNVIEGADQSQLTYLANAGMLDGLPANTADVPRAPNALDPSTGDVESRARAYLDINCAHCHNTHGTAGTTSRLFLQHDMTDAFSLGVCKRPGSAGGSLGGEFDILPGDHEHSILWNRVHSTESGKMMPQIGRALSHAEGAQLIADWIDAMPAQTCQ